ncbi:cytoplasmic protein [Cryptococcus neoformans Bt85]|nr:cytoplasmic protein [Cryptococcus neoformans var. grubii Bt85]
MSKRLSRRKQREVEELESLRTPTSLPEGLAGEREESEDEGPPPLLSVPVNAFAALEEEDYNEDDVEEEEQHTPSIIAGKSKKKNKKKKSSKNAKAPDPFAGLDEIDRALAELKLRYGEEASEASSSKTADIAGEGRGSMSFRNLLSVDPKNLDADAELRRFFGSKVIASTAQPSKRRLGVPSKLRYTISKPKSQYPPTTSLSGLVMREMLNEEVNELYRRRGRGQLDKGEKWFTFEHVGAWREIERQFMGAVQSHDPNQLMALLQVYPWHVDTLLQMSEVYRLQSDIGAASDYAERALYAFDRCLMPTFSVVSGASRLDFDRVENRPLFTALHRIISYLGRRGCWATAFNFAKLLFSLDPEGDHHGAAFWLDFLAIKSGNSSWLLSMINQGDSQPAAASWFAYPGMAYAKALALRMEEEKSKSQDHTESDQALREAITDFPQVVVPLADKIGASLPEGIRSEVLFSVEAGYSESPSNAIQLLSHIYVSRSEALWKDANRLQWFEDQVAHALPELYSEPSKVARDDVLALIQAPRDPMDESVNVPSFICRHVLCSENTSWLAFLPPIITSRPFHSFDPLPPTTAISVYDSSYFSGVRPSGRGGVTTNGRPEGAWQMMNTFVEQIFDAVQQDLGNWRERVQAIWEQLERENDMGRLPQAERDNMYEGLIRLAENVADGLYAHQAVNPGAMPGAFPEDEGNH